MTAWIASDTRVHDLCRVTGAQRVFMPWAWPRQPKPTKVRGWLRSARRTWQVVRPLPPGAVVIVMVPPIWNPLTVLAARHRGVHVVLDVHSGAVIGTRWRWSVRLLAWASQRASAVIVTNVAVLGGLDVGSTPVLALTDPGMADAHPTPSRPTGRPIVVFPGSGEDDEPLDALAGAAELLVSEARVIATGRLPERLRGGALEVPGYLPKDEYDALVASASVVLALTSRPHTYQMSASEAVRRGVPLVCSDSELLRGTFAGTAVFVANDAAAIAAGVRDALARRDELAEGAVLAAGRLRANALEGLADLARLTGLRSPLLDR